jgi:hypothetical protein
VLHARSCTAGAARQVLDGSGDTGRERALIGSVGRLKTCVALCVAILAIMANDAAAQSCACARTEPPCSAYWRADVVFVGRVDLVTRAKAQHIVTLTVLEGFRGVASSVVTVANAQPGQGCAVRFRVSREYLVYGTRDEATGRVTTGPCDRTREVEDAASDLTYARAIEDGTALSGRIGGQVLVGRRDLSGRMTGPRRPLPNVLVRVSKDGALDTAITNDAGDFSVAGRSAGRYAVGLDLPDRYDVENDPRPVDLRDPRGCALVETVVHDNGRVFGRVIDGTGHPVAGLTVDLAAPNLKQRTATVTDRLGQYEFARVSSGRFIVGLPMGTQPSRASPVGGRLALSVPVQVADGNRVGVADIRLPSLLGLLRLSGFVVDADGVPAEGARVYLKSAAEDGSILSAPAAADFLGRFDVAIIGGGDYEIFAERARGNRMDSSASSRIAAPGVRGTVTLVLRRRY